MGDILKNLSITVRGIAHKIKPIPRRLVNGYERFDVAGAARLPGGLVIGEGDTGKSTYVGMLAEEAKSCGPVKLVRLRGVGSVGEIARTFKETLVLRKAGQFATIIFDGLDERKDLALPIVDAVRDFGDGRCRVWVASRPGNCVAMLRESGCFPKVYSLSPFTNWMFYELARGIGLDGERITRQVREVTGTTSFLSKPGGAVLMLELYAAGLLKGKDRSGLMRTIALHFATDSSGGFTNKATAAKTSPEERLRAAAWIAVCLFVSGKDSISIDELPPERSLRFDDIPLFGQSRDLLVTALETRLFEPLTATELRPAYSAMAAYLAGTWMLESPVHRHIDEIFPDKSSPLTAFMAEVLSWVALIRPEIAKPYVARRPAAFFMCHEAIRAVGCSRYFNAMRDRLKANCSFDEEPWHDHLPDLEGFAELEKTVRARFLAKRATDAERELAVRILCATAVDRQKTAEAVVPFLLRATKFGTTHRTVADLLCKACKGETYPVLRKLRPILDRPVADRDDESIYCNVLELLWPWALPTSELAARLIKPTSVPPSRYGVFVEYELTEALQRSATADDLATLLTWVGSYWKDRSLACHELDTLALDIVGLARKHASDRRLAQALAKLTDVYFRRCGADTIPSTAEWRRAAFLELHLSPRKPRPAHAAEREDTPDVREVLTMLGRDDKGVVGWFLAHDTGSSFLRTQLLQKASVRQLAEICYVLKRSVQPTCQERRAVLHLCNLFLWPHVLKQIDAETLEFLEASRRKSRNVHIDTAVEKAREAYEEKYVRVNLPLVRLVSFCEERATKDGFDPYCDRGRIEPPDFTNLVSCKSFCHALYEALREKLAMKFHSETEAVNYILRGAGVDDPYYEDCLIARQLRKDRDWSRSSFTTYCKQRSCPKPKTIKRAAKKRAFATKASRELRHL